MRTRRMARSTGKRRKRLILRCLPVVIGMIVLAVLFLFAGRLLVYDQTPRKADVIIVLSGGYGRVDEGAALYQEGYAPMLLLSNSKEGGSPGSNMVKTALAFGIPESAILTEPNAESTHDNAVFTLEIMKERGYTSAIVVSSDFHMRRVKFNFERAYKDSGIALTYVDSNSGFQTDRWWTDPYSRRAVLNEYTKMVGNFFGYHGTEAKQTLGEWRFW